jgi:hypothetical protein
MSQDSTRNGRCCNTLPRIVTPTNPQLADSGGPTRRCPFAGSFSRASALYFKKATRASAFGTAHANTLRRIGPTQWMVALRSCGGEPSNRTLDHDAPWILAASRRGMATNQCPTRARAIFSRSKDPAGTPQPPGSFFVWSWLDAVINQRKTCVSSNSVMCRIAYGVPPSDRACGRHALGVGADLMPAARLPHSSIRS